jgi:hypothetical protein
MHGARTLPCDAGKGKRSSEQHELAELMADLEELEHEMDVDRDWERAECIVHGPSLICERCAAEERRGRPECHLPANFAHHNLTYHPGVGALEGLFSMSVAVLLQVNGNRTELGLRNFRCMQSPRTRHQIRHKMPPRKQVRPKRSSSRNGGQLHDTMQEHV